MLIGIEVEVVCFLNPGSMCDPLPERMKSIGFKKEFYNGMVEKTYLFKNRIDRKEIYSDLKKLLENSRLLIPLKSVLFPIADGAASCGVHVHIDCDNISDPDLAERLLVYDKFIRNPSLRFLTSHHVWGAIRHYSKEWKRKERFRPLAYSPDREDKPETWEIRIYDLEDIWNGTLERGIRILKQLSEGKSPSTSLMWKASGLWDRLISLDAEKVFIYDEGISEEDASFLSGVLNRKCPSYRVLGKRVSVKPRFYSLTNLDMVSLNEVIFEKAEREVSTCVA